MDWSPPYRLYVVEFQNGVIKAGISATPGTRRIYSLSRKWPIRRHVFTGVVAGFTVEQELCKRLARIGCVLKGREWFTGIHFRAAAQLAHQMARAKSA